MEIGGKSTINLTLNPGISQVEILEVILNTNYVTEKEKNLPEEEQHKGTVLSFKLKDRKSTDERILRLDFYAPRKALADIPQKILASRLNHLYEVISGKMFPLSHYNNENIEDNYKAYLTDIYNGIIVESKPLFQTPEGQNYTYHLIAGYGKDGNFGIPAFAPFVEKYVKDKATTLKIDPNWVLMSKPIVADKKSTTTTDDLPDNNSGTKGDDDIPF